MCNLLKLLCFSEFKKRVNSLLGNVRKRKPTYAPARDEFGVVVKGPPQKPRKIRKRKENQNTGEIIVC